MRQTRLKLLAWFANLIGKEVTQEIECPDCAYTTATDFNVVELPNHIIEIDHESTERCDCKKGLPVGMFYIE